MPVDIAILKNKDPLQDLPSEMLRDIADSASMKSYEAGEVIFDLGDTDDMHVYLVWGQIELRAHDGKVTRLRHVDDRSQYALAKLKPRRLQARAALNGTCVVWVTSDLVEETFSEFRDSMLTPEEDEIVVEGVFR